MRNLMAILAGSMFGAGLLISGMTNTLKVQGWLDVFGNWDPTLAFVMGGAVIVTFIGYRLVWRRNAPLFGGGFQIPNNNIIDARLVGGSAFFGVGWGIAGFCPGAAIPALGTGRWEVVLFLAAVTAGFYARRLLAPIQQTTKAA